MTFRVRHWHWVAFVVVVLIGFGILEYLAVVNEGVTLSQAVVDADRQWRLFGVILALIVGGLMVHFFWHWQPQQPKAIPDEQRPDNGHH